MIEVKQLSKHFGSKTAVDGVSFTVKKGEVLGFLGPNEAGKSTTMRMITGFFAPSSGSVTLAGIDVWENPKEAKKHLGYLPESAPLYTDMTVKSFLQFTAEIRGFREATKREAVDKAVETCFLQPVLRQSIDTLSKGYRHRTCLAQSLIHDPDILILDEPTDGLDPNQKHEVRELIRRMGRDKAIIFSTHILEEVEAACSRAIIIDRGKVVADGTPNELRNRSGGSVSVTISGKSASALKTELAKLPSCDSISVISEEGQTLRARLKPKKGSSEKLREAVFEFATDQKLKLSELSDEEGRLDEFFRSITRSDADSN